MRKELWPYPEVVLTSGTLVDPLSNICRALVKHPSSISRAFCRPCFGATKNSPRNAWSTGVVLFFWRSDLQGSGTCKPRVLCRKVVSLSHALGAAAGGHELLLQTYSGRHFSRTSDAPVGQCQRKLERSWPAPCRCGVSGQAAPNSICVERTRRQTSATLDDFWEDPGPECPAFAIWASRRKLWATFDPTRLPDLARPYQRYVLPARVEAPFRYLSLPKSCLL